jgi:hypothetical protein
VSKGPVRVSWEESSLTKPYRYMFQRMREKAAVMDETICRLEDSLREKFGFGCVLDVITINCRTEMCSVFNFSFCSVLQGIVGFPSA